jgi:NTP pyrophosphatase (non-canonical NTP hydrolase)
MPSQLSDHPTLPEFQAYIRALVAERGWETDPNAAFVHFTEEVGELAKEMRKLHKLGQAQPEAAGEVADVFFFLCDLANHLGVDMNAAILSKLHVNEGRTWEY